MPEQIDELYNSYRGKRVDQINADIDRRMIEGDGRDPVWTAVRDKSIESEFQLDALDKVPEPERSEKYALARLSVIYSFIPTTQRHKIRAIFFRRPERQANTDTKA